MRKIWINGEDFSFCRKNANEIPAQDTQKKGQNYKSWRFGAPCDTEMNTSDLDEH